MKEEEAKKLFDEIIPFEYNYHKTGRRTKCTAEITLKIATLIARGSSARDASVLAGIASCTYQKWRNRGRKELTRLQELGVEDDDVSLADVDEVPYLVFFHATEKAIPIRKALYLGRIERAGRDPRNWKAIAWLLERLHPDEYGRSTRLEIRQIDWRIEVIEGIRDGLEFEVIARKIGDEETRTLFERAGMEVPGDGADEETSEDDTVNSRTHS